MKLTIKTSKLQEMVSKAIKGAGNNKLIPLTGLIGINLKDGKLTITTTDASNYLYVTQDNVDGEDFYVTIQSDIFYKLVSKLTSEDVTLDVSDSSLNVSANGDYKIDIPFDENGDPVKYPNPLADFEFTNRIGSISKEQVARVLASVKPALSVTMKIPCYTNYYVGESIIATDTFKVACLSNCNVLNEPHLVSSQTMNLLEVATSDIEVYASGNRVVYKANDVQLYSTEVGGIEAFNAEAIGGLLTQTMGSSCCVSKEQLLQALDRVSLFLGSFDNGQIELEFSETYLGVHSIGGRGVEKIKYLESTNPVQFKCNVSVLDLVPQVKAQSGESIKVNYGEDNAIIIADNDLISIVALLSE